MPLRTVPEGFEEFRRRLTTSTTETEAAKGHRASIEACLKSNFGLLRFFRSELQTPHKGVVRVGHSYLGTSSNRMLSAALYLAAARLGRGVARAVRRPLRDV